MPPNFQTFDFFDLVTKKAVSAKTLETLTPARLKDPTQIYDSLKMNINDVIDFKDHTLMDTTLKSSMIESREVRVAIHAATTKWVQDLISQYGYKSRRELFKDMKHCSVMCTKGQITINPSRHEKLKAWGGKGIKDSDHVVLPVDSSPAEIGAALRLALSRCIG